MCLACEAIKNPEVKFTFIYVKKQYLQEEIRYRVETLHNESYYAPEGVGAQVLFKKYRNGIK